jgi:hypothetical protein
MAVLGALQQAGEANLDVFVEIAAGDGEKLDPLQDGIGGVLGLFQHTAVEVDPRFVAPCKLLLPLRTLDHIREV